jgi:hypothetical protein
VLPDKGVVELVSATHTSRSQPLRNSSFKIIVEGISYVYKFENLLKIFVVSEGGRLLYYKIEKII